MIHPRSLSTGLTRRSGVQCSQSLGQLLSGCSPGQASGRHQSAKHSASSPRCPAHKSIFRPSSDPEDDAGRRDQRPFPRSGSEKTPLCWCWASLGKARSVSPGALLESFRPAHLSVAFLYRWTLPSMIPVPALGGESLFGQFTASIGEQLAHFPVGPALTDRFWYAISELCVQFRSCAAAAARKCRW